VLALLLGEVGVAEVVGLDEVDEAGVGRDGHAARGELERAEFLVEDGAQLLEGEDAQGVHGDGHDALGTLLGGEAGRVLEALVGQRGQVEAALVHVGEPGAARKGQHCLTTLHTHLDVSKIV